MMWLEEDTPYLEKTPAHFAALVGYARMRHVKSLIRFVIGHFAVDSTRLRWARVTRQQFHFSWPYRTCCGSPPLQVTTVRSTPLVEASEHVDHHRRPSIVTRPDSIQGLHGRTQRYHRAVHHRSRQRGPSPAWKETR